MGRLAANPTAAPSFLGPNGGEMAQLVRSKDWAATPLGRPESWPANIRTAVGMCLNSRFPILLWIGPELRLVYNDAYIPFLGSTKHPAMLGAPGREAWGEIWPSIGPMHDEVAQGRATYVQDFQFFIDRSLPHEEVYVTFSFSPILDDEGSNVLGVFCACTETTAKILGKRRLSVLRSLQVRTADVSNENAACQHAARLLADDPLDIPFAAIYLTDDDGGMAHRVALVGLAPEDRQACPAEQPTVGPPIPGTWPLADVARTGALVECRAIPKEFGRLASPLWADPVELALILPLATSREEPLAGFLVVGISPRRVLDEDYRDFLRMAASHIGNAIADTRALDQAEARLRAAIDLVGLSLYTWNPMTDEVEWDDRIRTMWGLPPGAPVDGQTWLSAIHHADRPKVEAAVARCTDPQGDGIYALEYRVIGINDGVERWVQTYGRTVFEDHRAVGFTGAAMEITERKRREARLRRSEERFRSFAENIDGVLWIADPQTGKVEYLSPAHVHLWGQGGAPGTLDDWKGTIHPDDIDHMSSVLERAAQGDVLSYQYRIQRPNGSTAWVKDRAFPIRDEVGQVRRIAGVAYSIAGHGNQQVYSIGMRQAASGSLTEKLRNASFEVKAFPSLAAFLDVAPALVTGCALLDLEGAHRRELELLKRVRQARADIPLIVLGAKTDDISAAVRAMRAGAADYIPRPFNPRQVVDAVSSAHSEVNQRLLSNQTEDQVVARLSRLSSRERTVLDGILRGGTNKFIARDLKLSPRTVEMHRKRMMEKLGANTLSEVIEIALKAGLKLSIRERAPRRGT